MGCNSCLRRKCSRAFSVLHHKLRMHDYFVDNFNIYGDTFCFGNPAEPPSILTRNVRNVEYVMSQKKGNNFNNYIKGHIVKEVTAEMLGNGIFAVDGKEWRTQRKLASHMFTLRFLRYALTLHTHTRNIAMHFFRLCPLN